MKAVDMDTFRDKLLAIRERINGEVQLLTQEAIEGKDTAYPDHLTGPSCDTSELQITLSMLESEENILHEIDEALQRIDTGEYGTCQMSGQPIPMARLRVIPWARYRIECARLAEQSKG